MQMPMAKSRAEHFADRAVHDLAARTWLAAFLDHWLVQGVQGTGAPALEAVAAE
jgi:GMP synthase (glutamine-hydrolysing)